MLYGLKTTNNEIVFQSKFVEDVLVQMKNYPNAYIVEIEEKPKKKRNYSEEFLQ